MRTKPVSFLASFSVTRLRPALRATGAMLALLMTLPAFQKNDTARAETIRPDSRRLADYATKLDDMQAILRVTRFEPKELEKIGPDLRLTYSLQRLTLHYAQPDKLRLEARSPTRGNALLITNGATRFFSVPKMHLRRVENLSASPGRRQSLLEYGGIIAGDTLQFMQGRFVKEDVQQGQTTLVFDLTYQGAAGGTHYRIWLDPKTRVTLRRDWLDGANKLKASFLYQEPLEVAPDIWMPSRVDVKNADGAIAASITMTGVKINQGLDASLFTIMP